MENICIIQSEEFLSSAIPLECKPHRCAVATNVLLCVAGRGLLLFNYEPEKWNQWYPYFSSVSFLHDFSANTYAELVSEFREECQQHPEVESRFTKAEEAFSQLLSLDGPVKIGSSSLPSEMWLKYSKTQDIWTLYLIEFLQVNEMPEVNFDSLDKDMVTFLPLTSKCIQEVVSTGKYRGIDVVDNTLDILSDSQALEAVRSKELLV